MLYAQDKHAEALDYYHKSLEINMKVYSPDHPSVARAYGNMGLVYNSMGDFPKALEYHNRNLETKLRVFGPEHPLVAKIYNM